MTEQAKPKNGQTYTAIVYARTSGGDDTEDRIDGTGKVSDITQIQDGITLAQKHSYKVIFEAKDIHRSGRTYPTDSQDSPIDKDADFAEYFANRIKSRKRYSRDGLAEVLKHLAEADYLIIRDITRLCRPFRNSYLLSYLWQLLRKYNVTIILHDGDTITPTNENQKAIKAFVLSIEDSSLEKGHSAHLRSVSLKRDSGEIYSCSSFYGFEKDGLIVGSIRPIATEITVVSEMFRLYLEDTPLGEICRKFNTQHIYTRKNKQWSRESLKLILSRPHYSGYQYNSKKELVVSKPFEPYKVIDLEQWQLVQARLLETDKYKATKEKLVIHALSGLVFCSCGSRMLLRRKNGKLLDYYYVCEHAADRTESNIGTACKMSAIAEHYHSSNNDNQATGLLEGLRPLLSCHILEHLQKTNGSYDLKAKQNALDIQAADIDRKQTKLVTMFSSDDMSEPDFDKLSERLKLDRLKLKAEQEALQKDLALTLSLSSTLADLNAAVWQGLPPVTERRLFHSSIERVTVYPYHVRICLKNRKCFLLTRYLKGNARLLPPVSYFYQGGKNEIPLVVYSYHSDNTISETLYQDETIKVMSNGVPKKPSRSAVLEDPQEYKRLYELPQTVKP